MQKSLNAAVEKESNICNYMLTKFFVTFMAMQTSFQNERGQNMWILIKINFIVCSTLHKTVTLYIVFVLR